ncbi:ribonuclease H-like domain-containing protein [Tanacetum coccineum]|uniref:Ribonuclease H-like domain-containing protein n=1 Tax=Tanacetum coccineum TaxID=301880 RepID=A0ABQ5I9D5_9ASTR
MVEIDKPPKDKGKEGGSSELKLDVYDPLYLHHNDIGSQLITFKLEGTKNYKVWSAAVQLALHTRNKLGFVDGTCVRDENDALRQSQWDRYVAHHMREQSPVHHHFSPSQAQAPSHMPTDDLLQTVPKLISRIDSLELDLKQTKLTMGNAIVKLVKKVKKLEGFLKEEDYAHASGEVQSGMKYAQTLLKQPKLSQRLPLRNRLIPYKETEEAESIHLDAASAQRIADDRRVE